GGVRSRVGGELELATVCPKVSQPNAIVWSPRAQRRQLYGSVVGLRWRSAGSRQRQAALHRRPPCAPVPATVRRWFVPRLAKGQGRSPSTCQKIASQLAMEGAPTCRRSNRRRRCSPSHPPAPPSH